MICPDVRYAYKNTDGGWPGQLRWPMKWLIHEYVIQGHLIRPLKFSSSRGNVGENARDIIFLFFTSININNRMYPESYRVYFKVNFGSSQSLNAGISLAFLFHVLLNDCSAFFRRGLNRAIPRRGHLGIESGELR